MNSRGSLLILMLWSLALFATFSITLGYGARLRATLLKRVEAREDLYALASSGIERARWLVLSDEKQDVDSFEDTWVSSPRYFKEVALAGGTYTVSYAAQADGESWTTWYGIEDQERKINLNKADAKTLERLLENIAELSKDDAESLSQCLVDWRDQDSNFQHPTYGAEDSYYDDLENPYNCKDAPFESYEEFLLVKGMKPEIFDKIKPYVTLFGSGSVNINTASKQVLTALGIGESAAEKILDFRRGADGKDGGNDDVVFLDAKTIPTALEKAVPPLNAAERAAVEILVEQDKLGVKASAFSAKSRAAYGRSPAFLEVEAVIDRSGRIVYWRTQGVQWPQKA